MVLILLCAPVTWAMSAVWLLPLLAIVVGRARPRNPAFVACVLGLLVVGAPDVYERTAGTALEPVGNLKYVLGELLCLGGLLGLWRAGDRIAEAPCER